SGDYTRRIQGVAPGLIAKESPDAINGSQLYWAYEAIADQRWYVSVTSTDGTTLIVNRQTIGSYDKSPNAGNVNFVAGEGIIITAESGDKGGSKALRLTFASTGGGGVNFDFSGDFGSPVVPSKDTAAYLTGELGSGVASSDLIGGNIGIVSSSDDQGNAVLAVKLNKKLNLSGDGSIQFGGSGLKITSADLTVGDTTINGFGLVISEGPSVTTAGISAGGKKITNVEAGTLSSDSMEAVNGSQLWATNQSVDQNTKNITAVSGEAARHTTVVKGDGNISIDEITTETGKVYALSLSSDISVTNSITVGNDTGSLKITSVDLKVGSTTINGYGLVISGGPSVTTTGISAGGLRITNIAPGTANTDAAAFGQIVGSVDISKQLSGSTLTTTVTLTTNSGDPITSSDSINLAQGAIAPGSAGLVSGDAIYKAISGAAGSSGWTLSAGDSSEYIASGDIVRFASSNDHLAVSLSTDADAKTSTVLFGVKTNGTIGGANDAGIVTGETVSAEVRPSRDGTYVMTAQTTGDNLLSLDSQVKANYDTIVSLNASGWSLAVDGGSGVRVTSSDTVTLISGANMKLTQIGTSVSFDVLTNGAISAGNAGIVTGGTVFTEVRPASDGRYVRTAQTAGENLLSLDAAIGYVEEDGLYIRSSAVNSVADNLIALDRQLDVTAASTDAHTKLIDAHGKSIDEVTETANKGWNLGVADGELSKVAPGGNVRMAVSQDEKTDLLKLSESSVDDVRTITFSVADNPTFAGTVAALGGFDARGAKIVNVAEGTADTDAVNVKQLNDAVGKSGKLAVLYDSEEKTTVTLNPGGKSAKITNLANGQVAKDSTDAVNGSQLFGIGKSIFGDTAFVNDDGSIKEYSITYEDGNTYSSVTDALYATDKTVSRMKEHFTTKKLTVNGDSEFTGNVTVGGTFTANGPAVFNDTVTMNRGLSVSGGVLNMNGNKITNLAPGTDEGDAATYGQLQSVASRADAMYSNLDSSIRRTGSRAAALAGLHPLPYDPDAPTTFTAAVGNYRGDTTAAIGLTHHFSRDAMLSVAGTIGEEPMLNAGLSLRLGRSDEKVIEARKRKRRETAEKNRLIGLVETQGKELEALKKRLHALEQRGTK
ncbi:MAG: hypothetical protein IJU32_05670, partial [Pyramidobacter sp.]|nr:hypothetical protein [Pyramidobacter sp.]